MTQKTSIEWCDKSSNPLRAFHVETGKRGWFCVHASAGCTNCYAEKRNRWIGNGLLYRAQDAHLVRFEMNVKELHSWQRLPVGTKVFPFDMTDLFQEGVPDTLIAQAYAAFASAPAVTFQVLTKRASRARLLLSSEAFRLQVSKWWKGNLHIPYDADVQPWPTWPLPNVWQMVSVEDQPNADARIAELVQTPAAVRGVSYEPALGAVDFGLSQIRCSCCPRPAHRWVRVRERVYADFAFLLKDGAPRVIEPGVYRAESNPHGALSVHGIGIKPAEFERLPGVDWIVCGGESGKARPFYVSWAWDVRRQVLEAGGSCALFMKQMGAVPLVPACRQSHFDYGSSFGRDTEGGKVFAEWPLDPKVWRWKLGRKGADPSLWPKALRVREFPRESA